MTRIVYTFRIRFDVARRTQIAVPAAELDLPVPPGDPAVVLKSYNKSEPIKDASTLIVLSHGHPDDDMARSRAEQYRCALIHAFAQLRISADFGESAAQRAFTKLARDDMPTEAERPVLNDVPGIMTWLSDSGPMLARGYPPTLIIGTNEARLRHTLADALAIAKPVSERHQLAYDLFSASFRETTPDARLILLMMSVETLLEAEPRAPDVQQHVEFLIQQTAGAGHLTKAERASICGSLTWLRTQSVGQAGRQLARTLGTRQYAGMRPASFFTKAYSIRSALVHGTQPRPSRQEIGSTAANLEIFVADLLASESW